MPKTVIIKLHLYVKIANILLSSKIFLSKSICCEDIISVPLYMYTSVMVQ